MQPYINESKAKHAYRIFTADREPVDCGRVLYIAKWQSSCVL